MAGPFVGREDELAALHELAATVTRGRRAAALVVGDPGIGKSRLLGEFAHALRGLAVLRMTGYEPERSVAFAAARDLFGELAGTPKGAVIGRLTESVSEPARTASVSALQVRLFEAAHVAREAIGPALLVVDDVQWLDPASAALAHYLLRAAGAPASPMAVVLGGRHAPATVTMWSSIRRLDPAGGVRLELGPIPRHDALRLANAIAPDVGRDAFEAALDRSAGSPFWLERLLRRGPAGGDEVRGELRGLASDPMTALALLACAGRPLPTRSVPELLGWTVRRVHRAGAPLLSAGLLLEGGSEVRVAHDLIRDAVLAHASPELRRPLHAALAEWLGARSDDVLALLEALAHSESAGRSPLALAHRIATASGRRLIGEPGLARLDAIATGCDVAAEECRELQRAVARLAVELGVHATAHARWSGLLEVERGPRAARAALGAARSALELGRRDEAWELLDRAERNARSAAVRIEVDAARSAVMRYLDHRPSEARSYALEAVRLARRLVRGRRVLPRELRDAYLHALVAATDAALVNDDPVQMLQLADELADLTARTSPRTHVDALTQGSLARRLLGRNRDAETRLARAWDLARAQVMPQAILEVGAMRGVVLLTLGRLDEAAEVSGELIALGRRLAEFRPSRAFSIILPHLIELSRGDWRRAVDGLQGAAREESDPHYRLHAHLERALALARIEPRRHAAQARAALDGARRDADSAGCRRCASEVLARGAEALARIGDSTAAEELLAQLEAVPVATLPDRAMAWWVERARAQARRDGATRLTALLDEADGHGLVLEAIWCRLDLARSLMARDRTQAAQVARRAGEDAQRIGARTEARIADALLRSLGVRTWRRAPRQHRPGAPASVLTDRERELVALVRSGASNPEIAGAVFLSRKTVERHLSNAMAKLGVRNRAELVAAIDRLEATGEH